MKISFDKRTMSDIGLNVAGTLFSPIFGLIAIPYILRQIGSERFGVFSLILAGLTYLSVFDLGAGRGTTYYVSRYHEKRQIKATRIIKAAFRIQFAIGMVISLISFLLIPVIVNDFLEIPFSLKHETLGAFWITSLSFPFVLSLSSSRGALEGLQRFDLSNKVRMLSSAAVFLLPAAISFFTPNLILISFGILFGRVLIFYMYELALKGQFSSWGLLPKRLFWGYCRQLVGYGGWIMVSVVVGSLMLAGYLDRYVIGALWGLKEVALYTIPSEIAMRLLLIPGAISGIFFADIAKARSSNSSVAIESRRLYSYLLIGSIPILPVFVLREEILSFMMGAQYDQVSCAVSTFLIIGTFVVALAHVPFTVLQAAGHPRPTALRHIIQLPFYAFAIIWCTKKYGLLGTSVVWMVWTIVDYLMLVYIYNRTFCRDMEKK